MRGGERWRDGEEKGLLWMIKLAEIVMDRKKFFHSLHTFLSEKIFSKNHGFIFILNNIIISASNAIYFANCAL